MKTWILLYVTFCVMYPVQLGLIKKDTGAKTETQLPHMPHIEDGFKTIHKMDDQECIPRLLCEMAVSAQNSTLSKEETSILAVFSNGDKTSDKSKPDRKTPLNLYKYATDIGKSGTEVDRCQKNFSKCPLTGNDLILAFKTIIVKH